jgi:hypothetical protein
MNMKQSLAIAVVAVLAASSSGTAQSQPTPGQIVARVKQSLAESQKRLRQYERLETTPGECRSSLFSRVARRVHGLRSAL